MRAHRPFWPDFGVSFLAPQAAVGAVKTARCASIGLSSGGYRAWQGREKQRRLKSILLRSLSGGDA
jgi:hypothetical protein